jgi:hypothetical protein
MSELVLDLAITIGSGLAGYLINYFRERLHLKDEEQIERTIDLLESRLKYFLWPLYFRFEEMNDLGYSFTEKELVEWNKKVFRILHTHIHLISQIQTVKLTIKYIRTFNEWRVSGKNRHYFPFNIATEFHHHLQKVTSKEQERYNSLIGESTDKILHRYQPISQLSSILKKIENVYEKEGDNPYLLTGIKIINYAIDK